MPRDKKVVNVRVTFGNTKFEFVDFGYEQFQSTLVSGLASRKLRAISKYVGFRFGKPKVTSNFKAPWFQVWQAENYKLVWSLLK